MGGYGSGRPSHKQKIESCKSLDINRFHRKGILATGRRGSWIWSQDAVEVGRIDYEAQEGCLILKYKVQRYGDEWEHVRQSTPVVYLPCRYGGQRPYFQCPGVMSGRHCGRRVAKLFLGGNYFLCRHCYRLAYSSQSEPRYDRMLAQGPDRIALCAFLHFREFGATWGERRNLYLDQISPKRTFLSCPSGGERSFAAACTKVSYAQIVTFAKLR
jgi:hypothetical protein